MTCVGICIHERILGATALSSTRRERGYEYAQGHQHYKTASVAPLPPYSMPISSLRFRSLLSVLHLTWVQESTIHHALAYFFNLTGRPWPNSLGLAYSREP
ncbi:hypothetical protein GGR58DRAFT_475767 [Xylaria digitata]|nr:hypothetical protein GGR58DRAFT_475767 [Xylaria digitata]